MAHFGVAATCVPQPGTCRSMPATGYDHVVRLQISSPGKAEIAIVLKHCVNIHVWRGAGFDCQLRKLGGCYAARDTVQPGTWLDHISTGRHPQTS